jgi:hypothetical protein
MEETVIDVNLVGNEVWSYLLFFFLDLLSLRGVEEEAGTNFAILSSERNISGIGMVRLKFRNALIVA